MAVVNNTLSAIGDLLLIKTTKPLVGVTTFDGYSDIVSGETGTRFFTKTFRYSTTGFLWSEWQSLTDVNVQAISNFKSYEPVYFEFQYQRAGSDSTGLLTFEQVEIESTFTNPDDTVFSKTVFADVFVTQFNADLYGWAMNVLDKIYKDGVVAKFIERGVENHSEIHVDRDYIDFWRTICLYFSFIVNYGRVFRNLFTERDLLFDYLIGRGLYLRGNESLAQLQELCKNFFDEIRKRPNTQAIDSYQINGVDVDGEILRLINIYPDEDYYYRATLVQEMGWNVGNCSPCYHGVIDTYSFVTAYEKNPFQTITNYPIIDPGTCCSLVLESGVKVLKIENVQSNQYAGIGDSFKSPTREKEIAINPQLDYAIVFDIKQSIIFEDITFGVGVFDKFGLDVQIQKIDGTGPTNYFFQEKALNIEDEYYTVVGVLYNENEPVQSAQDSVLNIGFGSKLRLTSESKKIVPFLVVDHRSNVEEDQVVHIRKFRVIPLRSRYGFCFIQSSNFIHAWFQNNNTQKSPDQLYEILRRFFVPYNTALLTTILNKPEFADLSQYWQDILGENWMEATGEPWFWY